MLIQNPALLSKDGAQLCGISTKVRGFTSRESKPGPPDFEPQDRGTR